MIDFHFIQQLECDTDPGTLGCVPAPDTSQSGVTIGCGFDIGQCNEAEIERAFDTPLARKLAPYCGKIKHEAERYLAQHPLILTPDEVADVNHYAHSRAEHRLKTQWRRYVGAPDFDDLSNACQTVVASVAFQYGSLDRTPRFKHCVTSQDWKGAIKELRHFGDAYPYRRSREADLLEAWYLAGVNDEG